MAYRRNLIVCAALTLATACMVAAKEIAGQSAGAIATNMVTFATAGDASYFNPIFEPAGEIPRLMGMIKRSGMLTNYSERLESKSANNALLNYHYLERQCHFQVELQKADQTWKVTRIWLCR